RGVLIAQGQAPDPKQVYGVPLRYRLLFKKLRRAMAAAHASNLRPDDVSDGGVSLWGAYLDLIGLCYDQGYLSDTFIRYLMGGGLFGVGVNSSLLGDERWQTICAEQ